MAQESRELNKRYGGLVPCAVLDVTDAEARLLTIRMNRAKGTHVAVRMSSIVKTLVDEFHMERAQIAQEIGGTLDEIDLLYQDSIFKAKGLDKYRYSKAWVPVRVKRDGDPQNPI